MYFKHRTFDLLKIIDYLIVFFIILGTRSLFSVATTVNYHILTLTLVLIGGRLFVSIAYFAKIKKSMLVLSLSWSVYIVFYGLLAKGETSHLFIKFLLLFLLFVLYFYLLIDTHRLLSFFRAYADIMLVIAVISLFFWVLGSQLSILHPSGHIEFYWGKPRITGTYYNLYMEWQNDAKVFGRVIFRNIAIFTEAPMYSLNLSMAFLLDYFILRRRSVWRTGFYGLILLTTVSTTGILLFGLSLTLEPIITTLHSLFLKGKIKPYMIIVPIIIMLVFAFGAFLFTNKLSSASGSSRTEDYIVGFKAWMEHPIFGSGFSNTDIRKQFMSATRLARAEDGFTNSPTTVLTEGGIYFFLSYFIAFIYPLIAAIRKKDINLFVFMLMWIFLFITTTFEHTTLMVAYLALVFSILSHPNRNSLNIFNNTKTSIY